MSGETNLDLLLGNLSAILHPEVYVFSTLPDHAVPASVSARMIFKEEEGTTLILRKEEAEQHHLAFEFPCRMITLDIHSSLEAVGFIARIATELARQGMGVNPVSGFYHDHLFVPEGREDEALAVLTKLTGDKNA